MQGILKNHQLLEMIPKIFDKSLPSADTINREVSQSKDGLSAVLVNFKHLLFAYRWMQSDQIGYQSALRWLMTITDQVFYYYMSLNESLYAYHTIVISEYYMKKVL